MSFGCCPTGSHYALSIQNNMESAPLEVRRNVSRIMSTQPCKSVHSLLASWRHWRSTEKRGGTCVRRAYRAAFDVYDQEAEARRARRHAVTSAPASGPRCHICDCRICASESRLRSHLCCHRPSLTS